MKIRTRDQARAQHAYGCLDSFARAQPGHLDKYASLVNGFGATVMRNGLVAALAFARRRNDPAAKAFLEHLSEARIPGLANKNDLLQAVIALDVDDYLVATREVLALAVWFRRAMQASEASAPATRPGQEG
ncbi:MAG TPA: type III-B CRISPR module-associated protein Cmr5 [Haliangium sp.]|nr:type III-B CRISPR module-associated protein Cmr5 [Haliangium sp.]